MPRSRRGLAAAVRLLEALPLAPCTDIVWRAVPHGEDPLNSAGSLNYAGRWHNPGTTEALYAAHLQNTAVAEATAHLDPGTYVIDVVPLPVEIPRLLDLTAVPPGTRLARMLHQCLRLSDIASVRGAIVGDAAIHLGATALRAPCVRGPNFCLCLYRIGHNSCTKGQPITRTVVIP